MCVLNDTVVWHCSSKSVHYRTLQSSHKKESSKKNCSCSKGNCHSWGICSFPEPLLALGSWAGPPALESEGPDALVPDWSWGSGSFLCSCCYKSLFKGWRAWSLMSPVPGKIYLLKKHGVGEHLSTRLSLALPAPPTGGTTLFRAAFSQCTKSHTWLKWLRRHLPDTARTFTKCSVQSRRHPRRTPTTFFILPYLCVSGFKSLLHVHLCHFSPLYF